MPERMTQERRSLLYRLAETTGNGPLKEALDALAAERKAREDVESELVPLKTIRPKLADCESALRTARTENLLFEASVREARGEREDAVGVLVAIRGIAGEFASEEKYAEGLGTVRRIANEAIARLASRQALAPQAERRRDEPAP